MKNTYGSGISCDTVSIWNGLEWNQAVLIEALLEYFQIFAKILQYNVKVSITKSRSPYFMYLLFLKKCIFLFNFVTWILLTVWQASFPLCAVRQKTAGVKMHLWDCYIRDTDIYIHSRYWLHYINGKYER